MHLKANLLFLQFESARKKPLQQRKQTGELGEKAKVLYFGGGKRRRIIFYQILAQVRGDIRNLHKTNKFFSYLRDFLAKPRHNTSKA